MLDTVLGEQGSIDRTSLEGTTTLQTHTTINHTAADTVTDKGQGQYNYNDPYANPNQNQHYYPPTSTSPTPMNMPQARVGSLDAYAQAANGQTSYGNPNPNYQSSNPRISTGDPYGGYDDGLGGIGMAATSNAGRHEQEYTGAGGQGGGGYGDPGYEYNNIHTPQPQHLVNNTTSNLLRSPTSAQSDHYANAQRNDIVGIAPGPGSGPGYDNQPGGGGGGYNHNRDSIGQSQPPSYGMAVGNAGNGYQQQQQQQQRPNEKSGYH